MFWTTPASWLNDSSTRKELSRISHLFDCARASTAATDTHAVTIAMRRRCTSASIELHEQLRGRARADRNPSIPSAQLHRVGCGVARLDFDRLARLEVVVLDEAQERGILIGDPRHFQRSGERTGEQRVERACRDRSFRIRKDRKSVV